MCRKPNKLNEAFSIMIPGEPVFLAPGVRRILAGNPGLMTGAGTNTYLFGMREVAHLIKLARKGRAVERGGVWRVLRG